MGNRAIHPVISELICYGIKEGLMYPVDTVYVRNRVHDYLGIEPEDCAGAEGASTDMADAVSIEASPRAIDHILDDFIQWAHEKGRITSLDPDETDIFDAGLMDCLMPRPSEVINRYGFLKSHSNQMATDWFYKVGIASNYIRMGRIKKNRHWLVETPYGSMDITINLTKPEKDPKAIAAALEKQKGAKHSYPKCLLCRENEGYKGRLDHPARQNHRLIPMSLMGDQWYLQYSPYVYYNEHCIILSDKHEPMVMNRTTIGRLLECIDQLPHYFVGSNADLPIVGGSILTHDHFQGGRYEFAMTNAKAVEAVELGQPEGVSVTRLHWPMTVLRVSGEDKVEVLDTVTKIFGAWQTFSYEAADILSHTGDTPHNTITPICRKRDGRYEVDVVLRNNRTSDAFPDGIFHPHTELHHIKKENIGLIEVMGMAILPGRLERQIGTIADCLMGEKEWEQEVQSDVGLAVHDAWYEALKLKLADKSASDGSQILEAIHSDIGMIYANILEQAGVIKWDETGDKAFEAFVEKCRN